MMAKLGSPLGSPTRVQLRNRLPTQLRRVIALCLSCFALSWFVYHANPFPTAGMVGSPNSQASSEGADLVLAASRQRTDFPPKIWQVWKVNPLDFEQRDHDVAHTWLDRNPDYRYEVLTDGNEMRYVEYHYGPQGFNRPDIVEFFRDVKAVIVKSDLLRYLVMYAEGGIYADIDVEALKPVRKFVPERYDEKDIDMVIGVEIDEPDWKDHPILGPKSRSFCQWTFMCKPQQPVMMRLVEQIMKWLNDLAAAQNVAMGDVVLDFDEIISGTGPSAFTNAIIAEMNLHRPGPSNEITWDAFHDLGESKMVGRILVLTVEAFAAGQGHSESGNHDARAALVRHHYHASNWPSRHPRYSHPAYAEVELCNWNDECVHKWDEDVARFKTLDEAEQKRVIAEKEREREEQRAEEEKRRADEEERRRKQEEDERERKRKEEDDLAEKRRKEAEDAKRDAERKAADPTST